MKINEVETLLGISKANIRFYEKQGLLSPRRNENGYRDYSEEDVARLQEIIILRKLNVSVQQIADVLDGALPLQDAVANTISELKKEIERLNGSLALCQQLKEERSETLDTGRYWQLIQEKEKQGWNFQSIARDYWTFMAAYYEYVDVWGLPRELFQSPSKYVTYLLLLCILPAILSALITGEGFFYWFFQDVMIVARNFLFLTVILLPIYFYSKQDRKKAEEIREWVPIVLIVGGFLTAIIVSFLVVLF